MFYVYLLKSIRTSNKTYIGYTTNLKERVKKHNEGGSIYTKNDHPWELIAYIALNSEAKAKSMEKYLKEGSGHAFAKKRFW
ncbi:MAG: GIY-YIG nuclease family protein [bacterium]